MCVAILGGGFPAAITDTFASAAESLRAADEGRVAAPRLVFRAGHPRWSGPVPRVSIRVPTANQQRPSVDGRPPNELQLVIQTDRADAITDLALSADGRFLLTSGDATPRLWDISSGRVLREFNEHQRRVTSVAFVCPCEGEDDVVRLIL